MSEDVVNIEVDGRPLKARKGQMIMQLTDQAGIYVPRFCYHEKLLDRRQLPHVPRRGRESAEAHASLRNAGRRGNEGVHPVGARARGTEGNDGVPADQPPARLPDLRSGRRVRAAGPCARVRQREVPLRRAQARGQGQEHRAAHLDGHDTVHPLHALRPLHGGNCRHAGARRDWPWRVDGDRHLDREGRRSRAVRECHRPLPSRRAQLEAVPPSRALLGDDRACARVAA